MQALMLLLICCRNDLKIVSENFETHNDILNIISDKPYTYIGEVVVSVNPYKSLNIYNDRDIEVSTTQNF